MDFLAEVSSELLNSPIGRAYPDVASFAFYIRKANLAKLAAEFGNTAGRLGRGLCFHIAPANIPINFAFSWVFSLLAGNANIVRVPSKDFPQVAAVLAVIEKTLTKHPAIAERNAFVKYPRTDNETTAAYSEAADCRMIWGGDETIAAIKTLPSSPRCVDIAFADRYSVAIIDGAAVCAADDVQMVRLAEAFYNDTYLMDQNACSSPQLICWEHDSVEARTKFWTAVRGHAAKKYRLQDAVAVDKYTLLCEESIKNSAAATIFREGNLLYREELTFLPEDLMVHRGKGGYFFEYALTNRADLFAHITEKWQTITYFGLNPAALRDQIIAANLRGIDRIVPIGKAMEIGAIWDGHDLIRQLSRVIAI